ncbi:MAG: hypothetical protein AAB372_02735 [Patescibacteria group bacterium]
MQPRLWFALLFLCASVYGVRADTLATITFNATVSGFTSTGSGTWDDVTHDVFGIPINGSTDIGLTDFTITTTNASSVPLEIAGTIVSQATSGGNPILNASMTGYVDSDFTTILSGVSIPFAAIVNSLQSELGLPSDLSFIADGSSRCIADCETSTPQFEEVLALNAFQALETTTGSLVETNHSSVFFDPTTESERTIITDVTFDTVDTAGTTIITVSASSAAQFSFGFELLPNPVYFDVVTTATYSGNITICSPYNDTDNDGTVDGTSTLETDLVMMHNESGTFVDRTLLPIDTDNNIICAQVPSLSEFVVAAIAPPTTTTTSTTTTTLPTSNDTITGRQLQLSLDALRPSRNGLSITSSDTAIDVTSNPVTSGASVRVNSSRAGFDTTYLMPSSGWSYIGKPADNRGYRYKDKLGIFGPIQSARISRDSLRIRGRGPLLGHSLGSNPNPVNIKTTIGTTQYCIAFGGATKFVLQKRFTAQKSPAPTSCAF